MKSLKSILIAALGLSMAGIGTLRGEDKKPELPSGHPPVQEQPKLPAGHPTVPGATDPSLPAGHPTVPGANDPKLPAGHPTVPGATTQPGLPAGHPQIPSGITPVAPGSKATLVIKAQQKTKDAKVPGGNDVIVDYINAQGQVFGKSKAKLDDKGTVSIADVPFTQPLQPIITVIHGGVEYKALGDIMDGKRTSQEVAVPVFEVTEQEPAWQIRMRHIIVQPAQTGLTVTEMISVHNPSDRTWSGRLIEGGKKVSLVFDLPKGATDLQAMGAGADYAVLAPDGKVGYAMPMQPGSAELQIVYTLPAKDNQAEVTLASPAPTASVFVFLPEDGTTLTSKELTKVEPKAGATLRQDSRFFTAPAQKTGDVIKFVVSGLGALKPAVDPHGAKTDAGNSSGNTAKIVAAVGAGAILTVGVAVVMFKAPKNVVNKSSKK